MQLAFPFAQHVQGQATKENRRTDLVKEGQHQQTHLNKKLLKINKKLLKIYKILKKIEVKFYSLLFKNYLSSGFFAEVKCQNQYLKKTITLFNTESSTQPKQQGLDVDTKILFNSSTENKGQRVEALFQKVEADLHPFFTENPGFRANNRAIAPKINQYLKPALFEQRSSLQVTQASSLRGHMAIRQRGFSINGLIINSNSSFSGLYKIQRLLFLVEQERSYNNFATIKSKIISTATGQTLITDQQSTNFSIVVWGTNLESGVGKGKITNIVRKMYDLPHYQSSVILGLLLSDG